MCFGGVVVVPTVVQVSESIGSARRVRASIGLPSLWLPMTTTSAALLLKFEGSSRLAICA